MIERFVLLLSALLLPGAAHGAECPDGKAAKNGFVLERPGIRSVFRPFPENVVQLTNSFDSSPPQTQFFLGGLIEVFRTSKTGQFAVLPNSDFSTIFPLKEGAREELQWLQLDAEQNTVELRSLELQVVSKETLKLGACDYEVLAVKQTFKDGEGQELDTLTALYAPGLQAILAKRYDEGTDKEDTIAYNSIKPLVD